MRFLRLVILGSLLFFASCGEDDGGPSVDLFTATIADDYTEDPWEMKLLVYNNAGDLLAQRDAEAGETFTLSYDGPMPDGNLTIVSVKHAFTNPSRYYYVEVYTDIAPASSWNFVAIPNVPLLTALGSVNGKVSPYDFTGIYVTDKYGFPLFVNSGEFSGPIYSNKQNIVFRPHDGELKHKFLTDVKSNDVINLTPSDFVKYDTEVTFTFPGKPFILLNTYGYEADWKYPNYGYTLDVHSSTDQSTMKTGYMSSLSQFATVISFSYAPRKFVEYLKVGSIPNLNFPWPDPEKYTVANNSLSNFSSTTSESFKYRTSRYYYSEADVTVSWLVFTPSLTHKLPNLPSELLSQHPALAPSKAKASATLFVVGGETYEEYIGSHFKGEVHSEIERIGVNLMF